MHHGDQAQVVAEDAEDLVAVEVDALVERADGVVGERRAEAQAPVVAVQGEEVLGEGGAVGWAQADRQGR